jgi:hypothetical protein
MFRWVVLHYLVATHELIDELGNELLGVLVRAIHVVTTGNDNGQVETAHIGLGQELCTRLGGGIWVGGLKNIFLVHGVLVSELREKGKRGC